MYGYFRHLSDQSPKQPISFIYYQHLLLDVLPRELLKLSRLRTAFVHVVSYVVCALICSLVELATHGVVDLLSYLLPVVIGCLPNGCPVVISHVHCLTLHLWIISNLVSQHLLLNLLWVHYFR